MRTETLRLRPFSAILSPQRILWAIVLASWALYFFTLVRPYPLFRFAPLSPISLPEIARRQPGPAFAFLGTFLTLFALYAWAFWICLRNPRAVSLPFILLSSLAMAITLAFAHPGGAGDVVDYVTHGEELFYYRENPLVVPPGYLPDTAFARYSAYRMAPSNYGPIWTWISALVVGALGRESLTANLLGFKAVAILAHQVQALLVFLILRRRHPELALAGTVFLAWNPLALYEFAVNGHNDATMMAFALLGIYFWEHRSLLAMTAALALSFLIKIPTILLLPLFLLALLREESGAPQTLPSIRGWATRALPALAIVGLLVALAYLSLPRPLEALTNLSTRSGLFTHSLPAVLYLTLQLGGLGSEHAGMLVHGLILATLAAGLIRKLRRTWENPASVLRHAFDLVLFLLLFATPWFQPWYVTWAVALAALFPRRQAPLQAGLLSLTVVFSYVIYGFVWFWRADLGNWGNTLGITLMAVAATYILSVGLHPGCGH
ncbi:MAG: hypothetical protein RMK65_07940 [Anaerolineae bacterium]|nr:hypothetical protein [Anaerolineae bacterium]